MAEITATHHHHDIASSSTAPRFASTPDVYFDIFVNHSADETGDFAMELCKRLVSRGLYVFLDGIEKEVTPRMEAAISLASLQIAIFSENYVTCKWCMDTLVQMTKSDAHILPVFYQVEPSHLRYTGKGGKGPYAQWLRAHEGGPYDSETMQAWRNALENVSKLKGFELKKRNGGDEELLCKIVKSVESGMKARFYHVFICHRGETKEEFVEPLYRGLHGLRGLRVFLDKPELVAAHRIEPQIEAAIQFASVNIVIFSPKFPESSWCLDELLLMQTYGAKILPVFYGVNVGNFMVNSITQNIIEQLSDMMEFSAKFLNKQTTQNCSVSAQKTVNFVFWTWCCSNRNRCCSNRKNTMFLLTQEKQKTVAL